MRFEPLEVFQILALDFLSERIARKLRACAMRAYMAGGYVEVTWSLADKLSPPTLRIIDLYGYVDDPPGEAFIEKVEAAHKVAPDNLLTSDEALSIFAKLLNDLAQPVEDDEDD